MDENIKSEKYDKNFVAQNMMGPNSIVVLEELLDDIQIRNDMRILDLGCGTALTSIFLAKEFGAQTFAVDLWVSATENYKRLQQMKVDDIIIPIHADAHELPFPDGYFDAVISVDAYHYFGNNDEYFNQYLRPLLKKDALVALAFPGMKYEVQNHIPDKMKPFWNLEALEMWHSVDWWKSKFETCLENLRIQEMNCFDRAWSDWLSTDNPYAVEDRKMMAMDNRRYMNLISVTGTVR